MSAHEYSERLTSVLLSNQSKSNRLLLWFRMWFFLVQRKWWSVSKRFATQVTVIGSGRAGMYVWMLLKLLERKSVQIIDFNILTYLESYSLEKSFTTHNAFITILRSGFVWHFVLAQSLRIRRNLATDGTRLWSPNMPPVLLEQHPDDKLFNDKWTNNMKTYFKWALIESLFLYLKNKFR